MDLAKTIKDDFPRTKIVILGDLVADQFLNGTISRVSREAPVFILRHDETETLPGAAANTAANVASLGGKAHLVGIIGTDLNGDELRSALVSRGVNVDMVIAGTDHSTPTKMRVLAGQNYSPRQQVIRIDYESVTQPSTETKKRLIENLKTALSGAAGLIVSDYGYGTVFDEIVAIAKKICQENGIVMVVDSRHRLEGFARGVHATPNQEELEAILDGEPTTETCSMLREELELASLLATNGNKGMTLFLNDSDPIELPAVGSSQPVDVTGAGDTVIAAYSMGLASGLAPVEAARIANHAGGIVVMKRSTATVSPVELIGSISRHEASSTANSA